MRGKHKGKVGIVRTVDGATDTVQVRTGDPLKWAEYDAETNRMLEQMRGAK